MTTYLVSVGDLVAGKYRVERVLGQGGMGVVVAAMHEQLGQRVALKMLLPAATTSADSIARFTREARAAVKIRGEHVARVLDVGELASGAPFIVMEYLEGKDLADTLHEAGPLAPEVAVAYVLQACEALAEAHVSGIVHRDMKPSNVFVTRRPDGSPLVKVLDFGISKALVAGEGGGDARGLTTTSSFIGSPVYAPPEQLAASRDVDGRADIWGVGTILYEALTGTTPFKGETVMKIASEIFNATPEPLDNARPGLPEGLGAVVLKCLEKRADDRYPSVRELAAALAPYTPMGAAAAERVARILGGSLVPPAQAPSLADTVPAKSSMKPLPGRVTPPAASTLTAPNIVGAQSGAGATGAGRGTYAIVAVGFVVAVGLAFTFGRHEEKVAEPAASAAPSVIVTSTPTPAVTPTMSPTASSTPTATPADSTPSASASHALPHPSPPPPPPPPPRKSPLNVGVK